MKEMPIRRGSLPDAHACRPTQLQGYPDQRMESSLPQISWSYGKPQLYGRVAKSVQKQRHLSLIRRLLKKLHFNQDGIKRSRVAYVRQFFGGEHVDVAVAGCKFCPIQLG